MATYTFNPSPAASPASQQSNTGSSKSRIYETELKPTIELDELSLPANEESEEPKLEDYASLEYPLVKINDYILSKQEIQTLEINCTDTIPTITLKAVFVHKTFLSKEMPKDGDIISVAIRNKNDILKPLRNDYVITGVISAQNTTVMEGPTTLTFFGNLFIPWVSSAKFNFSYEGTSFEAMKDVAEKIGLGFATNEDNTDDKQVWLSGYSTTMDYIKNTVQRAYSTGESFYDAWVDIYYNLNFINVNKQLMSSEDEVDIAAWLNNIDKDQTYNANTDESDTITTPKVFSNYEGYRTTSFYINTWKPSNKATKITFDIGSKINCHLYEHNEKLYQDPEARKFWSFEMEPYYDPDKVDKYILLRGRAYQNPDDRGKDLARANYSYPDIYVNNPWMGVQYTISNPDDDNLQWDGNQHRNYLKARLQNLINSKELEKLNVDITVNGLNLNVIKGDKVPIVLIQPDKVEAAIAQKEGAGLDRLEQFYSGWYYIKGFRIKYDHTNDNSPMSNFTQTFTLTRREWPPPISVDAIEKENNTA